MLIKDLRTGREIEFIYNSLNCSITNGKSGWQFCVGNIVVANGYKNVEGIIESICRYEFGDGISLKEIFDKCLYEESTLYIL